MKTINDLIKNVYSPPTTNPSRICKCIEKNLEDFLVLYTSLSNTSKPKDSYLTEFNKILEALQDVEALSLGDVLNNGIRKINTLNEGVWKGVNLKYLRVTKRVNVDHNIDFNAPMTEQEVVLESTQPFDTLVAMKYVQKQLNAKQRGLEFTLTLSGETALSLDRINDELGYIPSNVVACASVVNQIKNELLEKNLCKGLTSSQIKRMLSSFVNIV